mgnify:FL=1
MARIRSIKPEFWTSEQIAECSPNARLLVIGMWSFYDDYGVHPASCARLKMEVFPADTISSADIRRMIDELTANGLLAEYEVDGARYWYVTGWDKHQKPDTKTGKYPRPDGSVGQKIRRTSAENSANGQRIDTEDSPNILRTVGDHSPPEKEKEKEKEKKTSTRSSASVAKPEDVSESVWADFLSLRKAKRAPVTETAIAAARREADKAGVTLQDALTICCAKGWQGFNADWIKPADLPAALAPKPDWMAGVL